MKGSRGPLAINLLLLAALCLLAYLPSLSIPLIEDDYPNLWESHLYGPAAALPALFHNPVFRLRATSYWTMWPMWRLFHVTAWPYHFFSLLLHALNVWLAYAVAWLWPRMRPAAFWAAAFFALAEGHQEAVMWFSAVSELYMFLFGAASLALWLLASGRPGRRWLLEAASAILFALALLSKESAVIWLPLFVLIRWGGPGCPPLLWARLPSSLDLPGTGGQTGTQATRSPRFAPLWPHLVLASLAVASVAESRGSSFRFSDGSFSLHAPFWLTWPYGIGRVLWPWGLVALAALLFFRLGKPAFLALGATKVRADPRGGSWFVSGHGFSRAAMPSSVLALAPAGGVFDAAFLALSWIGIALLPYSFLTYSRQIPSRQTYLASFGLALLVGVAMAHLEARKLRRTAAVAAIVLLLGNLGYLWTRKRAQFLARAEPTEQLIRLARQTQGPIWVQCYPRVPYIAQEAVHLAAGRSPSTLLWSRAEAERRKPAATFCYQER